VLAQYKPRSHIEHIYKIYAESLRGADHLRRILAEAQAIVGAALAAPMPQTELASGTQLKKGPCANKHGAVSCVLDLGSTRST